MGKEDFVTVIKSFRKETSDLAKKCQKVSGKQIQAKALLDEMEMLATRWFNEIEHLLRAAYAFDDGILLQYREPLGKILELAGGKPSKTVVLTIFDSILHSFHSDILVPVQKQRAALSKYPGLNIVLSHAKGLEIDYMTEAIECARLDKRRAAIILGWCAAVARCHLYIQKEGFDKFNHASVQMSAIQSGRYKRFNKKYDIQNLTDLRMTVFDNDLLWILEFMGAIDGNQHERLEICFTMRNTSAHPGEATVSDENVLSFFSDIDNLIFANQKFVI